VASVCCVENKTTATKWKKNKDDPLSNIGLAACDTVTRKRIKKRIANVQRKCTYQAQDFRDVLLLEQ